MLILSVDTSTNIGTFALYDTEKGVIGEISLNVKQNHSVIAMTAIDNLFNLTGVEKKDIDKIAVSIGPGTFTGIRIGVGIAKGLAYALKKSIVGINELDLLANFYNGDEKNIIAMIDAKKERVFYGKYYVENEKIKLIKNYDALELDIILNEIVEKTIFVGDGAEVYKEIIKNKLGEKAKFIKNSLNFPRASLLAELSKDREDNIFSLEPYYVTKSQAEREKENKK